MQLHLVGRHFQALALAGYSHQHHVVVFLKRGLSEELVDEAAVERNIGRAQLAVLVDLIHREHMVAGIHETVAPLQVQNLVDLSGKDQAVAAHDQLIVGNRRDNIVEMDNFYEAASADFIDSRLGDCLADIGIV